ncbi:helix-turn-helix domain-containing protein [Lactobacillus crispatus]|uniref:helix-turn-helix domain-containing protein n=1 Tax=Lactobacillus crispatus TaxID=47770 RepID=UPI0021A3B431|nr:helix-turn-helix transcriptional regulator [Lactobacillus crispatus]
MGINAALKKARQSRGLTQEQFVAGILSPAHYSKIERGLHDISAKDLMAILQKNKISFAEFFKQNMISQADDENSLGDQLQIAYYNQDLNQVRKLVTKIQQLPHHDLLKIKAKLIFTLLEGKRKFDVKDKNIILQRLFAGDNWLQDEFSLDLLANFGASIFTHDDFTFFFQKIFTTYNDKMSEQTEKMQTTIATICVNYLYTCAENKFGGL